MSLISALRVGHKALAESELCCVLPKENSSTNHPQPKPSINFSMADDGKKKNIAFFHPDLGIGGAERLIIDAAVGLQNRGHKVVIFTSYCDPQHCFDEARDGTRMPILHEGI